MIFWLGIVTIPLRDAILGKEMLLGCAKYAMSWFLYTKWKNSPLGEEWHAAWKSDVNSTSQHLVALEIKQKFVCLVFLPRLHALNSPRNLVHQSLMCPEGQHDREGKRGRKPADFWWVILFPLWLCFVRLLRGSVLGELWITTSFRETV